MVDDGRTGRKVREFSEKNSARQFRFNLLPQHDLRKLKRIGQQRKMCRLHSLNCRDAAGDFLPPRWIVLLPLCMSMLRPTLAFWLRWLARRWPGRANPAVYVLRGGKIVDGTGNPWFHGDVAIRGDRIVAVGRVASHGQAQDRRRGLSSRPASSTCTRTPTCCCSKTARPRARSARASPPRCSAKATRPARAKGKLPGKRATVGGKNGRVDDARRLLRRRGEVRRLRQRRLLRRPGQRLAVRDGQIVRPAHAGADSRR